MLSKKYRKNSDFLLGLTGVSIYSLWGFGWLIYAMLVKGSVFKPYRPATDIKSELLPFFSNNAFLGTDLYGRSMFEIISSGLIYSVSIGLLVSLVAATIGILAGYLSVRGPRLFKLFFEQLTTLIFIFPSILIAIVIMSVMPSSMLGLIFALIVTSWASYSRVVRGEALRILSMDYVEAARAVGVGEVRLFFKTILPELVPQVLIHVVLGISGIIISESALGFLGLGGSEYSWGALLSMGKDVLLEATHVVLILSFVMAGLIISLNTLGDGLRDILDPRHSENS